MKFKLRSMVVAWLVLLAFSACGGGGDGGGGGASSNSGPWNGNWIQVNFLSVDDSGVWGQDDPSGIGFEAVITESEWVESDESDCAVAFSYSVDNSNRHSKQGKSKSSECPSSLNPEILKETGTLEFSDNNNTMIEHFDPEPGDTILAFKWTRQQ